MQIPQPNISAYRNQYASINQSNQVPITLENENIRNQVTTGTNYAWIGGREDEGAMYRGYGCYQSNAPDHCCNIYCPLYYNAKSSVIGGNEWFI